MTQNVVAHRLEGRLFADEGQLCMVLEVDTSENKARISSNQRQYDIELHELTAKLAAYTHLSLDNMNSDRFSKRLVEQEDGWYYRSREEGLVGPYDTQALAKDQLQTYIIRAQEGRVPGAR